MDGTAKDGAASAPTADAVLRRLEWTVIRRLDGLLQGDYRTLWRGTGLDLADLREYQHHDDVRHIDWNVTARLQVPHVREFTEDREMSAWFLLDLSGSIDFGAQRSKRSVSAEFVTVLARLLTRNGNRVGAVFYGSEVDAVLPPRTGRSHVLNLLQRLRAHAAPQAAAKAETRLGDLLHRAATMIPRRSMVFVVSDFISAPGWADAMARLAQRHEVLAVRLYDEMELDLPDLGLVTLQDAETGEQLLVDTHDPGFRERFARIAETREDELHTAFARAGVDTLELTTDDDLGEALLRFVELRRQRARASHGGGMATHLRPLAARSAA
ncbi:DUF58 domain-containing protein [Rhizobacter sp. OV335]|uniref:DUF58 domain-containing protein n=1 Tax=Rhizobacter sp. OV335 TaxID=1500264 RepID=UPI00091E30E6|nr:DUF58 domain-containing protein [Rhizobacter sp. OV335]SHM67885.1 Protein of unknown function DUF58 [Rhizobacter sp. OV335]